MRMGLILNERKEKLIQPADPVGHDGVGVSLWKARDLTHEAWRQPRSLIIKRCDSKKVSRERGARGTDADKRLPSNGTGRFTEKAQGIAVSTALKVDM